MKVSEYRCDICGGKLETGIEIPKLGWVRKHIYGYTDWNFKVFGKDGHIDVCKDCFSKMLEWIREQKETKHEDEDNHVV